MRTLHGLCFIHFVCLFKDLLIAFSSLGMALVWFEFVKELRWHWEERVPLPALPTNQIDYNSCLLYQKLQMVLVLHCYLHRGWSELIFSQLNYCIGRARTMEGKDDPEEKLGMIESPLNEPTDSDGIEEEDNRSARSKKPSFSNISDWELKLNSGSFHRSM